MRRPAALHLPAQKRRAAPGRRLCAQKRRQGSAYFPADGPYCSRPAKLCRGARKFQKFFVLFCKKHLQHPELCDTILLGCKRLVRYKSCKPRYALMREVAARPGQTGCDGFFRGVCPILEPGERITDSKGIRSVRRRVTPLRGPNQCPTQFAPCCSGLNCQAVHRFSSCQVVKHPALCDVVYRLA